MRQHRGRAIASVLIALAMAAVGASVATPASAVPNLVRTVDFTAYDSTAVKEALAECPAGTRVLGGGGYIRGGTGNVHLIRLQALGSTDRFAAAAAENGAYGGDWRVYAYAICGQAPAGLTYVAGTSPTDSQTHKTAYLACPGDTTPISFGARVTGGGGQVVIGIFGPAAGANDARASATETEGGYSGNWRLWAHAVCADPLPGQELVWDSAVPADSDPDTIAVSCDSSKRVHGLGSTIVPSYGEVHHQGVVPNAALTSATAYAVEDSNGAAHDWWTRIYAICAY